MTKRDGSLFEMYWPKAALWAAVIDRVTNYWNQQLDHPEWLRTREFQAFAILTMCRALYQHDTKATQKPTSHVGGWFLGRGNLPGRSPDAEFVAIGVGELRP